MWVKEVLRWCFPLNLTYAYALLRAYIFRFKRKMLLVEGGIYKRRQWKSDWELFIPSDFGMSKGGAVTSENVGCHTPTR